MRRYLSLSLFLSLWERVGVRVPAEGTLRDIGLAAIPSPCPLPEGEDSRRTPLPEGEGSRRTPLPEGEGSHRRWARAIALSSRGGKNKTSRACRSSFAGTP